MAHLDLRVTAWRSGKEKGATARPVPPLRNSCSRASATPSQRSTPLTAGLARQRRNDQIDFYNEREDKLATACRVAAKAYGLGKRLMVFCPDADVAQRIDRMLWTAPPTVYSPLLLPPIRSRRNTDRDRLHRRDRFATGIAQLARRVAAVLGRFERLVEIVTYADDEQAASARTLQVLSRPGYELARTDMSEAAGGRRMSEESDDLPNPRPGGIFARADALLSGATAARRGTRRCRAG